MKKIVLMLMIAGGLAFAAVHYHFILLDDGMKVLKKADWTFEDTFVDARGAKQLKLFLKPSLVKAGIKDILHSK